MRLLTAISEMGVGGAERVVVDLLRDSAERDEATALLADPGKLDREIAGLEVERAPLPAGRSPAVLLRSATSATRMVRRFRPDVLHAHNVRVAGLVAIANRIAHPRRPRPLVVTYHGVPEEEVATAARILGQADAVVCVSSGLRDQLAEAGVAERLLSVVENGVPDAAPLDDERRRALDAELGLGDGPVVAIVGRLVPQKAHERFLAAAALVAERAPATRFLIVGDGPLRPDLERRAAELGLDREVVFTGIRSDARDLIARSDMLVFSSVWEGLSIAGLEALACGVPVVSTDVAGMRELLGDGAGIVVPHDDGALAAAMSELIGDPERRIAMGEAGLRLHADRFSTRRMVAAYRRLYAELDARRR